MVEGINTKYQNINFRLIVPLISARVRQNLSSVPAQSFAISSHNHSQYLCAIIRNIFAQSFATSLRNRKCFTKQFPPVHRRPGEEFFDPKGSRRSWNAVSLINFLKYAHCTRAQFSTVRLRWLDQDPHQNDYKTTDDYVKKSVKFLLFLKVCKWVSLLKINSSCQGFCTYSLSAGVSTTMSKLTAHTDLCTPKKRLKCWINILNILWFSR